MKMFNVINYNVNKKKFESYNIIPYLVNCYNEAKQKPKTYEEFEEFVEKQSLYQFWSRCEYEMILSDWPCQKIEEKWDIYDQIMMNLNIVTRILIENVV